MKTCLFFRAQFCLVFCPCPPASLSSIPQLAPVSPARHLTATSHCPTIFLLFQYKALKRSLSSLEVTPCPSAGTQIEGSPLLAPVSSLPGPPSFLLKLDAIIPKWWTLHTSAGWFWNSSQSCLFVGFATFSFSKLCLIAPTHHRRPVSSYHCVRRLSVHLPFTSYVDTVGHMGGLSLEKLLLAGFQLCARPAQSSAAHGTSTPCPLSSPHWFCSPHPPHLPGTCSQSRGSLTCLTLASCHSTWVWEPPASDITALFSSEPLWYPWLHPTAARGHLGLHVTCTGAKSWLISVLPTPLFFFFIVHSSSTSL